MFTKSTCVLCIPVGRAPVGSRYCFNLRDLHGALTDFVSVRKLVNKNACPSGRDRFRGGSEEETGSVLRLEDAS